MIRPSHTLRHVLIACLTAGATVLPSHPAFAGSGTAGSPAPSRATAPDELVSVVVKLDVAPLATYRGGVGGLVPTARAATGGTRLDARSSAARAYRAYVSRQIGAFEARLQRAIPAARTLYRYDVVVGGAALLVPASAVATIAALPGVAAVYPDERRDVLTDKSPKFIGAPTLWKKVGGQGAAGEGVIVGVLDTGIWPEHPSFADPGPDGRPYTMPPGLRYCAFSDGPNPGPPFACNGKLIAAYRFLGAYDACGTCPHPAGDFTSPRDTDGHGTHTASTAAGNANVRARILGIDRGVVSGIAPRAHVIAYKVCGPSDTGGCLVSDSVAAIQQAVLDGADVINFSISGGTDPYQDVVELAFLDAYAAGVFVAASAGNSGPAPNTVQHLGPWVTTVAASTEKRQFLAKVSVRGADGKKLKLAGASVTGGVKEPLPLLLASTVGDPLCLNATADGAFAGAIAVCKRGQISRIAKSYNVAQRGAAGMLLYNDPADESQRGLATDNHAIPSVMLEFDAGAALLQFVAQHGGAVASFTAGAAKGAKPDVIAAFSSRGGSELAVGVSKPDVTAPGVQILAGNTPAPLEPADPDGELFQVIQGTSMSSPHVAGAAALLHQLHPTWTPGQVKSALMTSASAAKLFKEDGVTAFDPFDAGAGRIDLKQALDPGLTFDVPAQDYEDFASELWSVNHPSIFSPLTAPDIMTVTRTAATENAKDVTWKVAVTRPADLVVAAPSILSLPARGSAPLTVTIDKSAVPPGATRHATLQLTGKGRRVRIPITAIGTAPLPDLVVTAVTASSPVTVGGTINLSATMSNVGDADAASSYTQFYVSTDTHLSADDKFFAYCFPFTLAAGAQYFCSFSATFQPNGGLSPGSYYVLARADDGQQVLERNEANNVRATASPITVN